MSQTGKLPDQKADSLEGRTYIIGREGHIYLSDLSISKQHAQISVSKGRVFLRDLDSLNGTYLLRDNKFVKFRKGYVDMDEPIVFGNKSLTARVLLRMIDSFSSP